MVPQPPALAAASTSSKPRPGARPPAAPVQGRGSILSYFSSSPQLGRAGAAATAAPPTSSPAPARAPAAPSLAASTTAGPSSSRQHRAPLRATHSLSTLQPGPSTLADSSHHRTTRSASTAAAAARPAQAPAPPPHAGPSTVRRSPRVGSFAASMASDSVPVKRESATPVKAKALRSRTGSATPVPAADAKGKGKARATPTPRKTKTIVIPDSSSEGEGGSSLAKEVLARSSPRKRVRPATSAATRSSLEQQQRTKRKKYKWTQGTDGRDELDLTVTSSPSAASTLGNSDSDADSEIVVLPSSSSLKGKQRAADAPRRTTSLTPRASTATAPKPKPPVGSPLVKHESLSSAGLGPSPSPAKPKPPPALDLGGGSTFMRLPKVVRAASVAVGRDRESADAQRMPPPPSPARASTSTSASGSRAASRAPATPSRQAAVRASVGRSGAASGAAAREPAPVTAPPSHKRVRSLSQSSSRSFVVELPASPARSVRGPAGPSAASGVRSPVASPSSPSTSRPLALDAPAASVMSSHRSAPTASPSTPRRIAKLSSTRTTSGGAASPSTRSTPTAAAAPAPASSSKLTASALRGVPPRTPQQQQQRTGPQLIRTPSGSPLSSLAPTPQKPRFTQAAAAATTGTGTGSRRKSQPFEIVIPPSRRRAQSARARSLAAPAPAPATASASVSASARRTALGATAPSRARERESGSGREWTRRQERDAATSEWDAFVHEGEGASGSEEEGAGSPSPAKKVKRDQAAARAASSSSSSNSSSSSSSDGDDDDAADSDAEDFAALLAAARAKREANAAGAASASHDTSPRTAKTTVSPPLDKGAHHLDDDDDERRRSSRARRQTERYSTSTAGATPGSTSTGAGSASMSKQGSGVRAPAALGLIRTTGLDDKVRRIVAEREAKDKKGRGAEWLAAWGRELDKDEDEFGLDDDDLDNRSDDSLPPLDTSLVSHALHGADSSDDDDLPAPSRAAASKRAQAVERLLLEERGAERQKAARGETADEREGRRVWPLRETRVAKLDAAEWEGEGWRGKVAQALKDGLTDPRSFPSALSLLSSLRPNGSAEDERIVAEWLTTTITHPSTPAFLADRLFSLLRRIASHIKPAHASVLVDAEHLGERLSLLGAWVVQQEGKDGAAAMDEGEAAVGKDDVKDDSTVAVGEHERREAVDRWSSILQILSGTSTCLLSDVDLMTLSMAVVGLMLDPSSASSRSTLGRALQSLLSSISNGSRFVLLRNLVKTYGASRPALHLAVLKSIPHVGDANKGLRRWLAWAFLSGIDADDIVVPADGLNSSVLPSMVGLLDDLPDKSPLHRRSLTAESGASTARDLALADCTRILFIALTSLDIPLISSPSRLHERQHLDAIISHLIAIDSRLRADARKGLAVERLVAKNLLTALTHSLTHQLRGARGQTGSGSFVFSEEEESAFKRSREADEPAREVKRARTDGGGAAVDGAGFKQTTLAFSKSVTASSGPAGEGAVDGAASSSKSDDEVEEELMKL